MESGYRIVLEFREIVRDLRRSYGTWDLGNFFLVSYLILVLDTT